MTQILIKVETTGPVASGKSTVIRRIIEALKEDFDIVGERYPPEGEQHSIIITASLKKE